MSQNKMELKFRNGMKLNIYSHNPTHVCCDVLSTGFKPTSNINAYILEGSVDQFQKYMSTKISDDDDLGYLLAESTAVHQFLGFSWSQKTNMVKVAHFTGHIDFTNSESLIRNIHGQSRLLDEVSFLSQDWEELPDPSPVERKLQNYSPEQSRFLRKLRENSRPAAFYFLNFLLGVGDDAYYDYHQSFPYVIVETFLLAIEEVLDGGTIID